MPTFPAGPRIAVSRVMAIGIMIVFLLIMIVGGIIIWSSRSQAIHPFLISVDDLTGTWQLVGHDHGQKTITQSHALQESVVAKFTKNWFTVSLNPNENDNMWLGMDNRENCESLSNTAQIFCNAGDELYNYFIYQIVPGYVTQIESGDSWSVNTDDIYPQPMANVTNDGGIWIVKTQVYSRTMGYIPVIAYVTVGRNMESYPQNMGFYVIDFNSYRI